MDVFGAIHSIGVFDAPPRSEIVEARIHLCRDVCPIVFVLCSQLDKVTGDVGTHEEQQQFYVCAVRLERGAGVRCVSAVRPEQRGVRNF